LENLKSSSNETEIDIKEYLQILWKGKWIIIICFLVSIIVGIGITSVSNTSPLYRATAKVLIAERNLPSAIFGQNELEYSSVSKTNFDTQVEILKSRQFKEEVIKLLSLRMTPSQLGGKMTITSIPGTNIISVSVYDSNPEQAAKIANALTDIYINWGEESYKDNLREILGEIEVTLEEARKKLDETSARISVLEENEAAVSESLKMALTIDSNLYLMLSEKYENLKIEEAMGKTTAEVIETAVIPGYSSQVSRYRTIGIAMLAGLLIGCIIVLLRNFFDNRIKTAEDIKKYLNLEVISHIEYNKANGKSRNELIILKDPKSITSETIKELRTTLGYFNVDKKIKKICITSSQLQEGKSFISANLAAAFAQSGIKTALLDCDFRRPNIHKYFKGNNESGITSVIAGYSELEDEIRDTDVDRLQYMASGPVPPNPIELLQSKKMSSLIEDMSKNTDFIIIDTPPIINVADWMVIGKEVDAIILVAKAGALTKFVASEVNEKIKVVRDKMLGVVLNGVIRRGRYYYHY